MSVDQFQLIKRYADHRLYDTTTLGYVTLDDLADMVLIGKTFLVIDAETDEDVTREVMKQLRGQLRAQTFGWVEHPFGSKARPSCGDGVEARAQAQASRENG